MSQRRAGGGGGAAAAPPPPRTTPEAPSSNNMKAGGGVSKQQQQNQEMVPLSVDDEYQKERLAAKMKHWRESPFAVGVVDVSWRGDYVSSGEAACCGGMCREEIDPDTAGCSCCSRLVCGKLLNAGRVGNMAILSQSQEWVEEEVDDEEEGEDGEEGGTETTHSDNNNDNDEENNAKATRKRRVLRLKLNWMVGPYWPMLMFVTYPLIFGVSGWTLVSAIPRMNIGIQMVWSILTVGLIYALAMTAFRNPGILHRYKRPPPDADSGWRWNDTAQTYRPRGAYYDPDCAVVVEGFDHTCPWTGTAIGKRNMLAFQFFVGLVFVAS